MKPEFCSIKLNDSTFLKLIVNNHKIKNNIDRRWTRSGQKSRKVVKIAHCLLGELCQVWCDFSYYSYESCNDCG